MAQMNKKLAVEKLVVLRVQLSVQYQVSLHLHPINYKLKICRVTPPMDNSTVKKGIDFGQYHKTFYERNLVLS